MKVIYSLSAALLIAGCQTMPAIAGPDFNVALDRHLAAIQSRDLSEMEATITLEPDMVLIFPDGSRLETRQQFLDFHKQWFADQTWVMTPEILRKWEGTDYSYALLRYSFDPDGDGPLAPSQSYLSLGFRLEEGEWRLVHDQNTRIVEPGPQ